MDDGKQRRLLIVDDEDNIVSAIRRALRRTGYQILVANSGAKALEILRDNRVGVILSDQRMPGMTGAEFLSHVKDLYPDTVRLMLSGYTDLESVTAAINKGAIYRFLTKPWKTEELIENVEEAFSIHELKQENAELNERLQVACRNLADANRQLTTAVEDKSHEVELSTIALEISRHIVDELPFAILGIGNTGQIAFANNRAIELLAPQQKALIGCEMSPLFGKKLFADYQQRLADITTTSWSWCETEINGIEYPMRMCVKRMVYNQIERTIVVLVSVM